MNLRTRLFDRITFHEANEPDWLTTDDTDTMQQLVARGWKSFEEKQDADKNRDKRLERDNEELRIHGETYRDFETLKGLTLVRIERDKYDEEILFHAIDTRGAGKMRLFKM